MNKFLQRNWITFIIYCDRIISKPIFKQLELSLRWLIFFLLMVSVALLIFGLHYIFTSCCRWYTTEKSWTIHLESLIIIISSFGRSTWMLRSSSWTCPPAMSLCCGARDHHYLACVSMTHRVSKVGCFPFHLLVMQCHRTMASLAEKVAVLHWKHDYTVLKVHTFVLYIICTYLHVCQLVSSFMV